MTLRGKPEIHIKLEPKIIALLKKRAPPVRGRSGGVSLLVRRLIYDFLGLPLPAQYGDLGRSSKLRKKAESKVPDTKKRKADAPATRKPLPRKNPSSNASA